MHTVKVLHKLLYQSVPSMHTTRLNTFLITVPALTQGAHATVTSLGRGLMGQAYDKHKIKPRIQVTLQKPIISRLENLNIPTKEFAHSLEPLWTFDTRP